MISSSISQLSTTTHTSYSSSSVHSVSLLRILSLATLFLGVRSQLFPPVIELSSLNGTTGFTLNGEAANDQSGISVSSAGDVNGDGIDDLIIGAHWANPTSIRERAGKTYVVFGKSGLNASGTLELSSLNGTSGFTINGEFFGDKSGYSVSSAGDVNGDGVEDLLIGARFADPASGREDAGKTYVVFGKSRLGSNGTLELSDLNGTTGFTINGEAAGDLSGDSVSSAGDVNGDGVDDLLIGAQHADPASGGNDAGKTYVVFGKSRVGASGTLELSSLDGTSGFAINGEAVIDRSGQSVSCAGDVNGDGIDDLLVGARYADPASGRKDAGKTYVVFGKSGLGANGTLELSSLDGTTGFTINGEFFGDRSGASVSSAGDVNGDGFEDLLIGAFKTTYVVFGKSGLGASGTLELSNLNGTTGFTINGESASDQIGRSVSSAGDVNGDGVDDLILGAYGANPSSFRMNAGKTYVVFGRKVISTSVSAPSTSFVSTPSSTSTQSSRSIQISSLSLQETTDASGTTEEPPSYNTVAPSPSSEGPSLALPLGIAGGVCALVSSIAAAVFAFRFRRKDSDQAAPSQTRTSEYASVDSSKLPSSQYTSLKVVDSHSSHYKNPWDVPHNSGSHYVGGKELEELNRQQVEYDAARNSQYGDLLSNQ